MNPVMAQWGSLNYNAVMDLTSVHFIDSVTGYIAGDSGLVLKTINGGVDWEDISTGDSVNINDVFFTNKDIGYLVCSDAVFLKTTDGGSSWSNKYASSISLNKLYFTSDDTGIAVGDNGLIMKTTNGGDSWSSISSGVIYFLTSVSFSGVDTGYAVGSNGTVLKTTDSGNSWSLLSTPTINILSGVHFSDGRIGYIVGKDGLVMKTTDGGSSFNTLDIGSSDWVKSVFSYDDRVYLTGQNGKLFKSTNDVDWGSQIIEGVSWFNDVHFSNKYFGYAVGSNGTLMKICPHAEFSVPSTTVNIANSDTLVFTNSARNYTSLLWEFGDGDKSTEKNPKHAYSKEGVFIPELIVYNESSCVGNASVIISVVDVLGVEEGDVNFDFMIYPNPFSTEVLIHFNLKETTELQIELFNPLGQRMVMDNTKTYLVGDHSVKLKMQKENLPDGIYILRLLANRKMYTRKLFYANE